MTKTVKHLLLYDGLFLINVEVCFKTAIVCRLKSDRKSKLSTKYVFGISMSFSIKFVWKFFAV